MSSRWFFGCLVVLMIGTQLALGQPGGSATPAGIDPRRLQFLQQIRETLGSNDEEWTVVEAKVATVLQLRRDAAGRGGWGGPQGADPQASPVQQKLASLDALLNDSRSTPRQIQAALQALREARAAAQAQLAKAQDELRALLSLRQEAALVEMGIIE